MTDPAGCPFCKRIRGRQFLLAARRTAVAIPDAHPVTPGHCLVLPKRHEPDFFELTIEEQGEILELVWELRELLEAEHDTTSFNVGVNAGVYAGQTVDHAHVHLIPRYEGDVPDPRGGVRWVIPDRAPYWEE
ncbi:MAG TPA: HIT family protein [Solirubrobacterales bacterium]|nr:HIT family protein [Solirubrobacterales bacterium]